MGRADRHRDHPPAGTHARLTSPNQSLRPTEEKPRARGTPPTRRDSRAVRLTGSGKTIPAGTRRPTSEDHERFRLGR
jgi:hypothetical protein